MLGLPKRTEINGKEGRNVPKNKFYSNLDLSDAQERLFVDEVKSIRWMNKISSDSMNLPESDGILEIEVFYILLKGADASERLLRMMDSAIVHPILFVLDDGVRKKVSISYKEASESGKVSVKSYYSTDWSKEAPLLDFSALSLGELYHSLISQVSGNRIASRDQGADLSESVDLDIERQAALAEIEGLKRKIKRTSQPNKKMELVHRLKALKNRWDIDG